MGQYCCGDKREKLNFVEASGRVELPDSFKRMDRAFSDLDAEFPVAGGRTPLVYQEKKVDSRSFIPEGKAQTPVEPRGEHPAMKALREAGDKLPEAS